MNTLLQEVRFFSVQLFNTHTHLYAIHTDKYTYIYIYIKYNSNIFCVCNFLKTNNTCLQATQDMIKLDL